MKMPDWVPNIEAVPRWAMAVDGIQLALFVVAAALIEPLMWVNTVLFGGMVGAGLFWAWHRLWGRHPTTGQGLALGTIAWLVALGGEVLLAAH